jgi:hypothetical protein
MSFRSLWNWFVGGVLKNLEMWTREALKCYKQSLVVLVMGAQKTRMPVETWSVRITLMKFQMETWTLWKPD